MRKREPKGSPKGTCSKCGEPKEPGRGKQRYCNFCHSEYMREFRGRKEAWVNKLIDTILKLGGEVPKMYS